MPNIYPKYAQVMPEDMPEESLKICLKMA